MHFYEMCGNAKTQDSVKGIVGRHLVRTDLARVHRHLHWGHTSMTYNAVTLRGLALGRPHYARCFLSVAGYCGGWDPKERLRRAVCVA